MNMTEKIKTKIGVILFMMVKYYFRNRWSNVTTMDNQLIRHWCEKCVLNVMFVVFIFSFFTSTVQAKDIIDISMPKTIIGKNIDEIIHYFGPMNSFNHPHDNYGSYTYAKYFKKFTRKYIFFYIKKDTFDDYRKGLNGKIIGYAISFYNSFYGSFAPLYSNTFLYDISQSKLIRYFNIKTLENADYIKSYDRRYGNIKFSKKGIKFKKQIEKFKVKNLNLKNFRYKAIGGIYFWAERDSEHEYYNRISLEARIDFIPDADNNMMLWIDCSSGITCYQKIRINVMYDSIVKHFPNINKKIREPMNLLQ